ncbi:MAG: amidohydrolase family protein [Verrucomicrobiota bacterium]|nr:amidohydrolase family protein [Verrucomicrobiota bacterium]
MKIDSHQHFWNYSREAYPWMTEAHEAIKRDFLPCDLEPILNGNQIDGCIAVQAQQTLEETGWLLKLAEENPFVKGVVGWLPFRDANVSDSLDRFATHPALVGARHVVHDEPDDDFILGKDFNRGIGELADYDLVYDILIFEKHLPQSIEFVDRHPHQQFVVDHIAKPRIDSRAFNESWRKNIVELAGRDNVACKLSGMATEVRDPEWNADLLEPYFETALEAFGPERLLFGSDWPVCLLRTDYNRWFDTVKTAIGELSASEQSAILGGNAERIYQS